MFTFLMIIHVIISAGLILVILAQSSKGGALDGMVGGTATNLLGGQGASKFLKNTTQILAVLFMVNCILLALQLKTPSQATSTSTKAVDKMREQVADQPQNEELPLLPETDQPVETDTETTE
ncbi:MAG: preprotein translocase subunit SecG [Candidatus Cloacimonetes bacterium]|nr:preprotein translocase subunit SecG [Candidatus Cloacimonadota bacterium]MCF7813938.1 preprotein translocase subunit SecG [Candidatus Cloacimonadota bacterium]MCF7868032.1 preprotein translocase subunit SecG [Candidatus Cloacimonadota bacterium]MCF7883952.1 preprotein translocase subunit SecG [Candidatus Cloacimonadota bacterium]